MDENGGSGVTHWAGEQFHAQARAWVAHAARAHGLELTGASEQPHNRPWSSAIRFDSTSGSLWFKVNGPGTRNEPALLGLLAGLMPDLVADVLAIDTDRGWSLTRDAGPMLRSTAGPDERWSRWEAILPRYADAQIGLSSHVPDLLATGTPEVSPSTLPEQAVALLKELSAAEPDAGGLTAQQGDALTAFMPAYADWCAELAASGIPSSIQHDDLHSGNPCWPGRGEARIIDWGDASVGHPLGTMLVTLNAFHHDAEVEPDDPRVQRVRDAYLEPFTWYADRAALLRYVGLVRRTGCVARALSYQRALLGEPVTTHTELEFPVRGWFLELLGG